MPISIVRRQAFTLVELLVVIAIIGILMGIAIPAITGALRKGKEAGIRTEVEALSQAIEAYKLKYGDYPPDFFDWNLVVRHYRKIFPHIEPNEIAILRDQCADITQVNSNTANPAHTTNRIDRAEALVWALGGFSSDPQKPFTGANGPLREIIPHPISARPTHYKNFAYNGTRDNSLHGFEDSLLTIGEFNTGSNSVLATDETEDATTASATLHDLFPVYLRSSDGAPFVYFDSRTYGASSSAGTSVNLYSSPLLHKWGRTRPYLSNKSVGPTESVVRTAGAGGPGLNFMAENSFQIISAGLDDVFGTATGIPHDPSDPDAGDPLYMSYPDGGEWKVDTSAALPSGETRLLISSVGTKYQETELSGVSTIDNHHNDNFANFAEGTLESELP